jgi:hypothetical protein
VVGLCRAQRAVASASPIARGACPVVLAFPLGARCRGRAVLLWPVLSRFLSINS